MARLHLCRSAHGRAACNGADFCAFAADLCGRLWASSAWGDSRPGHEEVVELGLHARPLALTRRLPPARGRGAANGCCDSAAAAVLLERRDGGGPRGGTSASVSIEELSIEFICTWARHDACYTSGRTQNLCRSHTHIFASGRGGVCAFLTTGVGAQEQTNACCSAVVLFAAATGSACVRGGAVATEQPRWQHASTSWHLLVPSSSGDDKGRAYSGLITWTARNDGQFAVGTGGLRFPIGRRLADNCGLYFSAHPQRPSHGTGRAVTDDSG